MKKLLISLLLCLSSAAYAAPFLWAVADPAADTCVFKPQGTAVTQDFPVVVLAAGDARPASFPSGAINVCKIDLANLSIAPVGTNNITLAVKSSLWGAVSSNVPFVFVRPSTSLPNPSNTVIAGNP